MTEAEGIPPSASVASVGPGLRYIAEHCYALSGEVDVISDTGNPETTMLEFVTGNGFIIAQVDWYLETDTNQNFRLKTYLNDIVSAAWLIGGVGTSSTEMRQYDPHTIMLPPFTKFKTTVANISTTSGSPRKWYTTLSGRVYEI